AGLGAPGAIGPGLRLKQPALAAKGWEFLGEFVPGLRRLAILANTASAGAVLDMREVDATARALGLNPLVLEIQRAEDIAPALGSLKGDAQALYVVVDPLVNVERARINALALGARLATMHGFREP